MGSGDRREDGALGGEHPPDAAIPRRLTPVCRYCCLGPVEHPLVVEALRPGK
jgi:hypothetical protein